MNEYIFDLRALQRGHEYRGIGEVALNITKSIIQKQTKTDHILLYEGPDVPKIISKSFSNNKVGSVTPVNVNYLNTSSLTPSVYVQYDYSIPNIEFTKAKKCLFLYDIIPFLFPQQYLMDWKGLLRKCHFIAAFKKYLFYLFYKSNILKTANQYDLIFCNSKATKSDLIQHIGIDAKKIIVTYLGYDPENNNFLQAGGADFSSLPSKYIFYIGGVDYRKRIDKIIDVYEKVKHQEKDIALVLAGKHLSPETNPPIISQWIQKSEFSKDIYQLGYVNAIQKKELYKNAHAFIFTSEYEGFGLPLIEAMHHGCPVVALKNSCIPEIVGDAGILCDSHNQMPSKILSFLNDYQQRRALIKEGEKRSTIYTWETTTDIILKEIMTTEKVEYD